jgi:hypothetical protein
MVGVGDGREVQSYTLPHHWATAIARGPVCMYVNSINAKGDVLHDLAITPV